MLYGLLESQSSHLSDIARALKEKTSLKKTIDRLSRNLNTFNENDLIIENYLQTVKKNTSNLSVLIIDNGDISKPYSKALESLCKVRDGSTGKITTGYHLMEITALTKDEKMPMPVYSHVYSSTDKDFISEEAEVIKGLEHISKHFDKNGIRTMDRG
jgi:S-adenosylhomocysteine hydrolase